MCKYKQVPRSGQRWSVQEEAQLIKELKEKALSGDDGIINSISEAHERTENAIVNRFAKIVKEYCPKCNAELNSIKNNTHIMYLVSEGVRSGVTKGQRAETCKSFVQEICGGSAACETCELYEKLYVDSYYQL